MISVVEKVGGGLRLNGAGSRRCIAGASLPSRATSSGVLFNPNISMFACLCVLGSASSVPALLYTLYYTTDNPPSGLPLTLSSEPWALSTEHASRCLFGSRGERDRHYESLVICVRMKVICVRMKVICVRMKVICVRMKVTSRQPTVWCPNPYLTVLFPQLSFWRYDHSSWKVPAHYGLCIVERYLRAFPAPPPSIWTPTRICVENLNFGRQEVPMGRWRKSVALPSRHFRPPPPSTPPPPPSFPSTPYTITNPP